MKKSIILILTIMFAAFIFTSSSAQAYKFSTKAKDPLVYGSEKSSPLGSTLKTKKNNNKTTDENKNVVK